MIKEEKAQIRCSHCNGTRGYFLDITRDSTVHYICYSCGNDYQPPKRKEDIR